MRGEVATMSRHCERSEAIHLAPVDCFATLAMTMSGFDS